MQSPEDADVTHQAGVIGIVAGLLGQQVFDQPEFFQLWQHLLHGTEHRVMGIYQGSMPVEEHGGGYSQSVITGPQWRASFTV
ncbi:hypothetical protein RE428_39290 [Marinobacter nanhaiticus D15-8W]|nr:hypothetical protein RE428_39290 [Marinobacter nanhaiticus D15-8W]